MYLVPWSLTSIDLIPVCSKNMYLILPVTCTLFQSSKMIKFGHRPYSSYEKNMYLITMYSIPLYLITAPQFWFFTVPKKQHCLKNVLLPNKSNCIHFMYHYYEQFGWQILTLSNCCLLYVYCNCIEKCMRYECVIWSMIECEVSERPTRTSW